MVRNDSLGWSRAARYLASITVGCALATGASSNASNGPGLHPGTRTFKAPNDERLVRLTIAPEVEGVIRARIDQSAADASHSRAVLDVGELRPWGGPLGQRRSWHTVLDLAIASAADTVTTEITVGEDTLRIVAERGALDSYARARTAWSPVLLEINGVGAWLDERAMSMAIAGDLDTADTARAALEDLVAAFADFERFKREFTKLQILLDGTRSTNVAVIGTRSCAMPCWRCATGLGAGMGTMIITLAGCSTVATGIGLAACLGGIGITSIRFMDAAMQCSECDHCLQRQRRAGRPDDPPDGDGCDPCEPTEGCPPASCDFPIP